ncbi:hypothetical protein B0011_06010 [Salmonella enterica subsp. diarizonae serovar 48:i:z]|nr:hypothetical protein [Salmonella enterica subsp. diarizonae serovar 48:i:z]
MATQPSMIPESKPNVFIHNGKVLTTSRYVADYFGKLHKDVIRKIESLDCSTDFTGRNFTLSEYTDSTGRKLPMYDMTKDGFVFLVMGFTGKKAAAFKEAYIAEFNRMEAELSHQYRKPEPVQEYYTLRLTSEAFCNLCWLCRIADNMRMGAYKIYPAMRELESPYMGVCRDMAMETAPTIKECKRILAKATQELKITPAQSPNWQRILPWLHGHHEPQNQ